MRTAKGLSGRRLLLRTLLLAAATPLAAPAGIAATDPARAGPAADLPALAQLGLTEMGQGELRFFGLKLYEARLFAPPNTPLSQLLEGPLGLELHYSRRFEGTDIARRSIEEMEGLGLIDRGLRDRRLAELRALFPTVDRDDRLLGLYRPQATSPFFFNGRPIGEIPDPRFAQSFFRIWLDPKTSEPRLREALIRRLSRP